MTIDVLIPALRLFLATIAVLSAIAVTLTIWALVVLALAGAVARRMDVPRKQQPNAEINE